MRATDETAELTVLVMTKTVGFRHDSIPSAIKAFAEMAGEEGWLVSLTEDARMISDSVLDRTDVVVFLLTSGDILDGEQEKAFQRFVQRGGGFVGVHSGGTDTEPDWPWFRGMVGAKFTGHPPVCEAVLKIEDLDHPATRHFGAAELEWRDEYYSFDRNPRDEVRVLVSVDESSYDTSNNPWFEGVELAMGDHPLVWTREFEGARVFQTALGHGKEIYDEPVFRKHLAGAVNWAGMRE